MKNFEFITNAITAASLIFLALAAHNLHAENRDLKIAIQAMIDNAARTHCSCGQAN